MLEQVLEILDGFGPSLSSELIERLKRSEGVSSETARKRIERARQRYGIAKLDHIGFRRNEAFYYLNKQKATPAFKTKLKEALFQTQSLWRLPLIGLEARGGICPKYLFPTYSGLPDKSTDKVTWKQAIDFLLEHGLLVEQSHELIGSYITIPSEEDLPEEVILALKSRLVVEKILLELIAGWARRLGFVSYGKHDIRSSENEPPQCGFFRWDLSGPSYSYPMLSMKSGKKVQGSFVADVIFGKTITAEEVLYFLHKAKYIHSNPNMGRAMTMLVASHYQHSAQKLGKEAGLIMATPASLFGERAADLLASLEKKLDRSADLIAQAEELLPELFSVANNIDSSDGGLRGFSFEFFSGWLAHEVYGDLPRIREPLPLTDGRTSDIDVYLKSGRRVYTVECKTVESGKPVDDKMIDYWAGTLIPAMRKYINTQPKQSDISKTFCFWTNGMFSREAITYLQHLRAQTRKIDIAWANGVELYAKATSVNKDIADAFRNAFSIEKSASRQSHEVSNDHSGSVTA